ncbi:MAG: nitrilase-related carbon-nitrogen hydrolase [Phycisphaerales bacterium]
MRIALAQLNATVGDIAGNTERIVRAIGEARAAGADRVVVPELAVSGYPPRDLLLVEGFVRACAAAAREIGERATAGITAVIGTPLPVDKDDYSKGTANSVVVFRDGAYVDYYDKRLLPTYDVFDEDRYFEAGARACVFEVAGRKVGVAICEDLWKGEDAGFGSRYADVGDPVAELTTRGAEVLVVPSASPFVVGKGAKHRAILRHHATRHGVWVASVNQVGGNDDLVFDGHACAVAPDGRMVAAAPGFDEHVLVFDVDDAAPAVADPVETSSGERLVLDALTVGVRDYLKSAEFSAVIGLSGGLIRR